MGKTRKLIASLFVGGMVAAGSVALAQPAAAQVPGCPDTLGTVVHGSGQYGATWSINNQLVSWTDTKCRYVGDKYSVSYNGPTKYQGKIYFYRTRG